MVSNENSSAMIRKSFREYSNKTLGRLRERLDRLNMTDQVVVTYGSYARREASENSDVDFFILSGEEHCSKDLIAEVRAAIKKVVPHSPASDGAFNDVEKRTKMLRNIGGSDDDNWNITRRVLLLLEGEWLFNCDGLQDLRKKILDRYVPESIADHQLALFLLNDIIRYYRTVAVDYEFKTTEAEEVKPWAIRNVKLVFSRKLLYASGLFSVAMTADRTREEKLEVLEQLFALPVIERMIFICGKSRMKPVLQSYQVYLDRMSDAGTRTHLQNLKPKGRKDPVFREIKNEGHRFTRELLKLLDDTFDSTHPIHRAVVL